MPSPLLGDAFSQVYAGELTSPNAQAYGIFGWSVAVSGTTVVVGAPYETASGDLDAGHAYVFNSKTGELISTLTSPNAQGGGAFGYSVAVSGAMVVVGAPYETASGDFYAGHAYVFDAKTGALIWTFTSPNAYLTGYFGSSVAVSGTTVVVGAWGETASGESEAGHAYIFNAKTGGLTWTLTSPHAQSDGYFGFSVAISGPTVVVGAWGETASGDSGAGNAYAFNAKTGAPISELTSPNALVNGYFGYSVAVSGPTVVVGAVGETASGERAAGHAYTFNAKKGTLMSTLSSPNAQAGGSFGLSVTIKGGTVVVGAPFETASGDSGAGNAYSFNAKTGAPIMTVTSPNPQPPSSNPAAILADSVFGWSVAVSGTTVVVGAPGESAFGLSEGGQVYLL